MTRSLILRCPDCRAYTMKAKCPQCGKATKNPVPAKFSPEDAYGEYRRRLKREPPVQGG